MQLSDSRRSVGFLRLVRLDWLLTIAYLVISFAKSTSFLVSLDLDLHTYTISGPLSDKSQVSDGTLRACHRAI